MSEQKVNLGTAGIAPQPQPGESGYVPPSDDVPLPSQGKIYSPESQLFGASTIAIRAMTARDEDILTSRALLKSGKAIDTLLKSCVINKAINTEQMVQGDRNAVLVAIRITGYGPEYKVKVDCPSCGQSVENTFDLNQLPIKNLGAEPNSPGVNEFSFTLPVSKKEAVIRLLTGADDAEISTILDKSRKMNGGGVEAAITTRLLYSLVALGGERDRSKLSQAVRNLPARDSRELRSFIEKISPGIEMKQDFTCGACGEEAEVDVPMGTEFFWPSA